MFDRTSEATFESDLVRDEVLETVERELHANPERGALIPRTGGARKIRAAFPGRGKRGRARVVYTYFRIREQVFFLMCYPKIALPTLTSEQEVAIRRLIERIREEL